MATIVPGLGLTLFLVLVSLFLLGRVLFIFGYRKGAGGRALGFALTFYPTVAAFGIFAVAFVIQL